MKLEIALIRNGQTVDSCEKRLLGITDVPLSNEGKSLIEKIKASKKYPEAAIVFSSGLARCFDTARLIYPSAPIIVLKGLCAPDYGSFEGMAYADLANDESFAQWPLRGNASADSEIENIYGDLARGSAAFRRICDEIAGKGLKRTSVVSHRIIIGMIMQKYHVPRSSYVDWDILPGKGYVLNYDTVTNNADIMRKF